MKFDTEGFRKDFEQPGFSVKQLDMGDGVFILGYNWTNEQHAWALRTALCRCRDEDKDSVEIVTTYKYFPKPHDREDCATRERVIITYTDDDDLRRIWGKAMGYFNTFVGRLATENGSYKASSRKRNLSGAVV